MMTQEQRLSRLESANFRLQVFLGLMIAMLAFLSLAAAQSKPSDTLRVSRLEIIDDKGVVRAILSPEQLAILNSQGMTQVLLTVNEPEGKESAGIVSVLNHAGQQIVSLERGNDGAGTIISRRKDGKDNIVIGAYPTGGIITLKDGRDRLACALGFLSDPSPKFFLLQPGGHSSVEMSTSIDSSSLKLRDADGKLRIGLNAANDLAMASLLSSGETPGISLMNATGKGNHILVQRDNGEKWIAPPQSP